MPAKVNGVEVQPFWVVFYNNMASPAKYSTRRDAVDAAKATAKRSSGTPVYVLKPVAVFSSQEPVVEEGSILPETP